jgi:hypothetical protein
MQGLPDAPVVVRRNRPAITGDLKLLKVGG